jgi:predicted permease
MIRVFRRLLALFTRTRIEDDLSREMTAHLALLEDEHRRRGLSPNDARLAACRAMGSVALARDLHREARSFAWVEDFSRDVRHALRTLRKTPGFTTIAVLTLALGIGANTAIFSVVNAVLLRGLPYEQSERLVRLMMTVPSTSTGVPQRQPVRLTATEFADLRANARTLSHVGTATWTLMNMRGRDPRLQGAVVSAELLHAVGARPMLGRVFTADDEAPGAGPVILISEAVWRRHFGGDASIIGRTIAFDPVLGPPVRTDYTVVGVMPSSFVFPDKQIRAWIPPRFAQQGPASRLPAVARLADGVSVEAAAAEVPRAVREIRAAQPAPPNTTYELVQDHDEVVRPVRPALRMLTIAVGLVLLIACVNVANLLLARTSSRQRETAIRGALGASRSRLIRQVLAESVTIGILGGLAGVALAFGSIRLLRTLAATLPRVDLGNQRNFPRLDEVVVDGPVLLWGIGIAVLTAVVFGLLPAVRHVRFSPALAMRNNSAASLPGHGIGRQGSVQSLLVTAEIALAVVLLVAGTLVIRSFVTLMSVDAGYDAAAVLTFQVAVPTDKYSPARLVPFADAVVERLRAVPDVRGAAYANQLPMVSLVNMFPLRATPFTPTPQVPRLPPAPGSPDVRLVSGDYLRVMNVRVLAGRGLGDGDRAGQPRALVINDALARRDFADRDPIGQTVYVGPDPHPWQIVGVVANVRQFGLDVEAQPQFFVNLQQWSLPGLIFPAGAYFAVRTTGDPAAIVPRLQALVREIETEAVVFYVAPMDEVVASTVARPRLYAALLGVFAAVGLGLALIGVYGMMAYAVTQGTREIGIRMALGAQRSAVLMQVLRQGLVMTTVGLLLGLGGAAVFSRYLEGILFGLEPHDPITFAAVTMLFTLVAAIASYVPARRATLVDPLIALRSE